MAALPKWVKRAVRSGHVPKIRDWKTRTDLTPGEMVLRFAYDHLVFPEGVMQGQPLELDIWQQAFVLAVFDSPVHVHKAMLSVARRNGKTLVLAVICLAYIIGPFAKRNTLVRSAAMTRDQAALLFRLMSLILDASPDCQNLYRTIPSSKKIVGLYRNVEYHALSRDAKAGHGQGIYVLVVDEAGQIDAPHDDFLDMLYSSMGTYDDSRVFIISTQSPTDAAYFSLELDAAERDKPDNVVSHVYMADADDPMDEKGWLRANPGLRAGFRSKDDIRRNAEEALRIPAKQSGFLNLFLNRRVARESLFLAPSVWKDNAGPPSLDVFMDQGVHMGLDLSQRNDLTAAVIAAMDPDNVIHVLPFAFTPEHGLEDRVRRDRAPYDAWVRDGQLVAVPGKTIDYEWVAAYLRRQVEERGIFIHSVQFDRWRIREFRAAADRSGFAQGAVWSEVGQGYKDQSVRVESLETALLQSRIRHGGHPVLNLGAAAAIAVSDPAGNRKLDKSKATQKIDALVAMLMAVHPLVAATEVEFDLEAMIG